MPTAAPHWQLTPAGRAAALAAVERASEAPGEAFRAAGSLCLARAAELVSPSMRDELRRHVDACVSGLQLERFVEHVEDLSSALEAEPPEDGLGDGGWAALAQSVLEERHRIELVLRGLSLVGFSRVAVGDERFSELELADRELSGQLWRLTALNEHRERQLEAVAPELREALWWYSRGAHLPSGAVTHLAAVASVVACFPEAGAELEALREAEGVLLAAGSEAAREEALASSPPASDKVVSLAERRLREPRSVEAAALTEGEVLAMSEGVHKPRFVAVLGWALSAAAVLFAVGSGVAFKRTAENAEREKAALLAEAEALKAEAAENVKRLEAQLRMTSTTSEAQKAVLESQIQAAKASAASASDVETAGGSAAARPSSRPTSAKPAAGVRKRSCGEGDPMCAD